jgi:hypothetical protein
MLHSLTRVRIFLERSAEILILAFAIFALLVATVSMIGAASPIGQRNFQSPEERVQELIKGILQLFGPEAKSFVETGDVVSD